MKTMKLSLTLVIILFVLNKAMPQGSKSFDQYCSELDLGCENEDSYDLILLTYFDCGECAEKIKSYAKCDDSKYFGIFVQKEGRQTKKAEFLTLIEDSESCIKWKEVSSTALLKLASQVSGEEVGPYAISVYKGRLVGVTKL